MSNKISTDSSTRTLTHVFNAYDCQDGAGVKLLRVFDVQTQDRCRLFDPFLLLDEFSSNDASDYIAGFPDHPHRGFETVTYMIEGLMEHRDHLGNQGRLVPGSVQWMTAASGIIHSEMPLQEEGRMQGFQLWVNLPAVDKMKAPHYQEFLPEEIPAYTPVHGVTIKVIAGEVSIRDVEIKGPVTDIATTPTYLDIGLTSGAQIDIPLFNNHTLITYVFEGALIVDLENGEQQRLTRSQMGRWSEGDLVKLVAGEEGARLLFLAAQPIGEPVVQYGPFVMNSQEEIHQALNDYRNGRFIVKVEE